MVIVALDSIINTVRPGTIIWRHTFKEEGAFGTTCTMQPFSFIKNLTGSWSCRTMLPGPNFLEPVAMSGRGKGIVTFIDKPPEGKWTHLVVTKLAGNKKAIFVTVGPVIDEDKFLDFKLKASHIPEDASFEDYLELTKGLGRFEKGSHRLYMRETESSFVTERID